MDPAETAGRARADNPPEALERVAALLGADPGVRDTTGHLAEEICRMLDVESCMILGWEPSTGTLTEAGLSGSPDPVVRQRVPRLTYISRAGDHEERLLQQGTWHVDNALDNDPRVNRDLVELLHARRLLTVPLRFQGEQVGIMHAVNKRGGDFTQEDAQLLMTLAPNVAAIISSSRQYEHTNRELSRRVHEQQLLVEASLALTSSLELGQVLTTLARRMTQLPRVNSCRIALIDADARTLTVRAAESRGAAEPEEVGHSFDYRVSPWHTRAIEERTPVVVQRLPGGEGAGTLPATTWLLLLPLLSGEKILGLVSVGEATGGARDPFTPERIRFYQIMATQAALAIEKSRLFGELQASEQNFRELFENANDIIYLHDLDGRLMAANHRALEAFGYSADQVVGMDVAQFLSPESMEVSRAHMRDVLRGRSEASAFELEARRSDGTTIPLDVRIRPVYRDRKPVAIQGIARDITERRRIEERLLQTERLRALGEVSAGVVHDFNNILAGVLGRAQLLLERTNDDDTRQGLRLIEKSAQDGARMLRRIQEFSRAEPEGQLETVSPRLLMEDAVEMTRPRWEGTLNRKTPFELRLELDDTPSVLGRPSELREVVVNLVNNALDAMPRGGTLTLTTALVDEAVEISVADTGLGMPPDVVKRAFDPFFTTKGRSGTGLGLSIAYKIISQHGGRITLDSTPGKGTTFVVTLPQGAAPVETGQPDEEVRDQRQLRILVIDDEPMLRELLERLLRRMGHEVVTAASGVEGLRAMTQGEFDLVMTDLGMPDITGWEVARQVKETHPETVVALVTGWGGELDGQEVKNGLVDLVVSKPFEIRDLVQCVRRATEIADAGAAT
ncbi:MAG: PAS domain S-box protein [Candidatus Dormibacteria bacterium]